MVRPKWAKGIDNCESTAKGDRPSLGERDLIVKLTIHPSLQDPLAFV